MKNQLKIHMNNHSETRKFIFPVCQKEFANQNEFDSHMNYHNKTSYEKMYLMSNTEDSLWKYVNCEKFENELDLKKHIESIHVHVETF